MPTKLENLIAQVVVLSAGILDQVVTLQDILQNGIWRDIFFERFIKRSEQWVFLQQREKYAKTISVLRQ